MRLACLVLTSALLAAGTSAHAESGHGAKVLVLRTRVDRSTDKALAATVTELVLDALGRAPALTAIGESDVAPFLDPSSQKQLSSCDDDAACMIEIGGTLGTDYLVMSSVGGLGQNYLVTARLFDAKQGVPIGRESVQVPKTEDALGAAVCPLVQQLFAGFVAKDPRLALNSSRCGGVAAAPAPAPPPAPVVVATPVAPAAAPVAPPRSFGAVETIAQAATAPPNLAGNPTALGEFNQKRFWVVEVPQTDPQGRVSRVNTFVFQGKYRTQLPPQLFYEKIGRPDLVKRYLAAEAERPKRLWAATGVLVGTYAAGLGLYFLAPDPGDPESSHYTSTLRTQSIMRASGATLMVLGTITSLVMYGWAAVTTTPVDGAETKRLAEEYNAKLARELEMRPVQ